MSIAPERQVKTVIEVRNEGVSFSGKLDTGELLTGTPTITEVTTSDLTITDKVVNTAAITLNGKSVPSGEAVQFSVTGGTSGKEYTINIVISTDATPAQILEGNVILRVRND